MVKFTKPSQSLEACLGKIVALYRRRTYEWIYTKGINPSDVLSDGVLKAEKATALYGERAKWIIITTKKSTWSLNTSKSKKSFWNCFLLPKSKTDNSETFSF
jgi:hypothetical protein